MTNIIILGHRGYVGKNIFNFLKKKRFNIKGFSSKEVNLISKKSISFLQKNVKKDSILIICAAIKSTISNEMSSLVDNNKIIENITAGIKNKKLKKVIYFSSCAIYGVHCKHSKLNEHYKFNPDTYYSLSKFYSENLLKLFVPKENLLIVRPTIVYGPNEQIYQGSPSGYINNFFKNKIISIWGDGSEVRNFIFIDDLVIKIFKLIKKNIFGEIILTGKNISYIKIIQSVKRLLKKKTKIIKKKRTKKKINKTYMSIYEKKFFNNFKTTSILEGSKKIIKSLYKYEL